MCEIRLLILEPTGIILGSSVILLKISGLIFSLLDNAQCEMSFLHHIYDVCYDGKYPKNISLLDLHTEFT